MKITKQHIPCPKCSSSDAYCEYEDGHGYCFACKYFKKAFDSEYMSNSQEKVSFQYVDWRSIKASSFEYYGVLTKVDEDGKPLSVGFKYPNGTTKVRQRDQKIFFTSGEKVREKGGNLFGSDKFPEGGKAITITEGELDAISVYQMFGSKYPAISVRSASSARKDCVEDYDYINSFEKIYICFDADEPGSAAAKEVANLFDFNKVYLVKLDPKLKDANGYLEKGSQDNFVRTWWNAKRFIPENIISSFSEIDNIIDEDIDKPSVPYPFSKLQDVTYGIRTGEVILFKALEGIGKTEIFRAIEYHLLKNTDANIGIIHLEEDKARMVKGLVGYELEQPVHLPDHQISKDDLKNTYRKLVKRDERVHIYTHFGSDDPDVILNTIRFMAGPCQCKYIFLDHITMVVTGSEVENERTALDYISTRLGMMVKELDFCLFMISHVNDQGQTRGSRNISKIAHTVIELKRDKLHPDPEIRNTTELIVEKNRFGSKTGPGGKLLFDISTFKINDLEELPT